MERWIFFLYFGIFFLLNSAEIQETKTEASKAENENLSYISDETGPETSRANQTPRPEASHDAEKIQCNVCLEACFPSAIVTTFLHVENMLFNEINKLVWIVRILGKALIEVAYALFRQAEGINLNVPSDQADSPPTGSKSFEPFTLFVKQKNPQKLPESQKSVFLEGSTPDSSNNELQDYVSIPLGSKNHSVSNSAKMINLETSSINKTTDSRETSELALRMQSNNENGNTTKKSSGKKLKKMKLVKTKHQNNKKGEKKKKKEEKKEGRKKKTKKNRSLHFFNEGKNRMPRPENILSIPAEISMLGL